MEREHLQILQPLRIPGGWEVGMNNFFMLDPAQYTGSDDGFWDNFVEDMLWIKRERTFKKDKQTYTKSIQVDLGWYPDGNMGGEFALYVIQDGDWDCPLAELRTRSQKEIVEAIEGFLITYSSPCYYR